VCDNLIINKFVRRMYNEENDFIIGRVRRVDYRC